MKYLQEITSVDVSGFGPFNSNALFHFSPTITFVVGDHRSGKSTLAAAVKNKVLENIMLLEDCKTHADLIPVMFIDDSVRLPYPGRPWNQGIPSWNNLEKYGQETSNVVSRFQTILSEIIQEKLSCSPKASSAVYSPYDISASISDDFCINIRHADTGMDLNFRFQAVGERTALFIALVFALREILPFGSSLPLVWDDFGGTLDRSLLPSCFNMLKNIQGQVILTMQREVADSLGVEADIDLS